MIHKIRDVVVQKKVKITFEDGMELFITRENYLRSGFLFPGKLIDDNTYEDLLRYESDEIYRNYLRQLIKKKNYSTYQLMVKLIEKKELEPKKARRLVGDLEREGMVSDDSYVITKIETLRYRGFSPKRITDYLTREAKIKAEVIEKYQDEIQKIDEDILEEIIETVFNKFRAHPINKRIEKAIKQLMKRGFTYSESKQMIDDYRSQNEVEDNEEQVINTAKMVLDRNFNKRDQFQPMRRNQLLINDLIKAGYSRAEAESHLAEYLADVIEDDPTMRIAADAERIMLYNISRINDTRAKKKSAFIKRMMKLGYSYRDAEWILKEKNYDFN